MTLPALVGIAVLPYIAFKAGSWIIRRLTRRQEVLDRIKAKLPENERNHLNERIRGYDVSAVQRLWGALRLDPPLLDRERAALRLDVIFPVLYGAAFAVSLLLAWRSWNRTSGLWLLVPVVIYLVADWTENLVHLRQLSIFRQSGPEALEPGWIQVASKATTVKLLFFIGCQLLLIALVVVSFLKADPS